MLLLIETIYSPIFSRFSHGFQEGHRFKAILKDIRLSWMGARWVIKGDLQSFYDTVDHHLLVKTLRKRIHCERFLQLIWKVLRAEVIENKKVLFFKSGLPPKGILSPVLANVYLNELDDFIEQLKIRYDLRCREGEIFDKPIFGKKYPFFRPGVRSNSTQCNLSRRDLRKILKFKKFRAVKFLRDPFNPIFRKVVFIRRADSWLIGVVGSKRLAEEIQNSIRFFLSSTLRLQLSERKVEIFPYFEKNIEFFGYCLKAKRKRLLFNGRSQNILGWEFRLLVPMTQVIYKLSEKNFCTKLGHAVRKNGWVRYSDKVIIDRYSSALRSLRHLYSFADNFGASTKRITYILKYSCAHTLATKHRSRVSKQLSKLDSFGLPLKGYSYDDLWAFKTTDSLLAFGFIL
jgi:hypothetical protein